MSWQICGECMGCLATPWHRERCIERNEEHEYSDEEYLKELERWNNATPAKSMPVSKELKEALDKALEERRRMKTQCPKCGSLSLNLGPVLTTLMYCPSFTDDEGNIHRHDCNKCTQSFTCRKCGHKFSADRPNKCWCGWTN